MCTCTIHHVNTIALSLWCIYIIIYYILLHLYVTLTTMFYMILYTHEKLNVTLTKLNCTFQKCTAFILVFLSLSPYAILLFSVVCFVGCSVTLLILWLLQVQFRQRNHAGALRLLDTAAQLSHSNPIPRFHKAKVLESLGHNEVGVALYVTRWAGHYTRVLTRCVQTRYPIHCLSFFISTSNNGSSNWVTYVCSHI